jgi:hypothetical protein
MQERSHASYSFILLHTVQTIALWLRIKSSIAMPTPCMSRAYLCDAEKRWLVVLVESWAPKPRQTDAVYLKPDRKRCSFQKTESLQAQDSALPMERVLVLVV